MVWPGSVPVLFLLLLLVAALPVAATPEASQAVSRQLYHDASVAISERRWDDYQQLRTRLDDYPLAIYLDFSALLRQLHQASPAQVNDFIERAADTPLPNRLLGAYLDHVGKRKRWDDFLAVMPREPNSVVLKCYYFRARLASGDAAQAWQGASSLWVHGHSQPDECDPLFDAWRKAGGLTDELVWQRSLAAFAAGQRSLMRYVARQGSAQLRPWTDRLDSIYAQPQRVLTEALPQEDTRSADIATRGLVYLARYSPEKALAGWNGMNQRLPFTPGQAKEVESEIALRSLFAKSDLHRQWLHGALDRLDDDKLTGIRLRWALEERDWETIGSTLPLLSEQERDADVWRYWSAMATEQRGDSAGALQGLQRLAGERSYYGFLAADKLGQPYNFQHQPAPEVSNPALLQLPALQRIEELRFHEEYALAHSEWHALMGRYAENDVAQLSRIAFDKGWHRKGIDAASRARLWDALELRFPLAYGNVFEYHAAAQQLPPNELQAIARRESAFYPQARSPVGARGLMQIMPATGSQVAAGINVPHSTAKLYDVEHNVRLGSTYYRELLDRFGGNRIFALTAYNAGPHRVDRWQNPPDKAQPLDVWVETIPFKETRNYVQAVLAYNLVFQYLQGQQSMVLLSAAEREHKY